MFRRLLLVAVLLSIVPIFASADSADRTLGGYRFIPSTMVLAPFATTHFGNRTGISAAINVKVPVIIIDGTPPDTLLSLGGDVIFVRTQFGYQYAFNQRFAVSVVGRGASRIGTTGESILSQGVSALFSGQVGGLYELWENDNMMLSVGGDVEWAQTLRVDLIQFAEDVVDGGVESAEILSTDSGVIYDALASYAWAISEWTGLTATGRIGGSNLAGRGDDVLWRVATAATIDLAQRDSHPVGFSAVFAYDKLTASTITSEAATTAGLGVFYTGREDLNLGFEFEWSRQPQVSTGTIIYPASFQLAMKYYF